MEFLAMVPTINDLSPQCLTIIFSHLEPRQLGAASCVQRSWRDHISQEDSIWQTICSERLGMQAAPVTHNGQPLPSYRSAWLAWHATLGKYGELAVRAYRAWRQIEDWAGANLPPIAASLRQGATEDALDKAERELGVHFPPALRAIYRLHDGQDLMFDAGVDTQRTVMHSSIFHGVFGGYAFYSHLVSTRMLSLRRMIRYTRHLRGALGMPEARVLFGSNFNFNKLVLCDTRDGSVKIACQDKHACLNASGPASPASDGILLWLEAFASSLVAGRFTAEPLDPDLPDSTAITLFPQRPPGRSEAVTRGVRVRALPVFIPELSQVQDEEEEDVGDNQYFFAYSVRFSLLDEAQQASHWPATAGPFRPLSSVQLRSRHWLIRDGRGSVESEVRGEAVVGHYPLLTAGGEEFSYQSCTHQRDAVGSMEGDFSFVEGSLQQPAGPGFDVLCAPFRLDVPEMFF